MLSFSILSGLWIVRIEKRVITSGLFHVGYPVPEGSSLIVIPNRRHDDGVCIGMKLIIVTYLVGL